jgi:hypothetical protein
MSNTIQKDLVLLAHIESVPVDIRTAVSGGRYHHRGSLY